MSRFSVKTVIIVFFDSSCIVHKEFVPPGQTVNHAFYKDVLERLRKLVQRVRTDIADDWVFISEGHIKTYQLFFSCFKLQTHYP